MFTPSIKEFEDLQAAVQGLAKVIRANQLHEPECPVFIREEFLRKSDMWQHEVDCTCWLSVKLPGE